MAASKMALIKSRSPAVKSFAYGVKAYERTIQLFEAAATDAQDPDVQAFADAALPWVRQRLAAAKALVRSEDGIATPLSRIGR